MVDPLPNPYPFNYDSMPVFSQATFQDIFSAPLTRSLGAPTSLALEAAVDAYTFDVLPGHSFAPGDFFIVADQGNIYFGTVLSVNVNQLTMDNPINFTYRANDSVVLKVTKELNVNGSSTPLVYAVAAPGDHVWSIHRLMITMICDGNPDDGLFGDLNPLTRGIVFRVRRNGSVRLVKANFKTNGDIAEECYDVTYTTRSGGGGQYGVRARISFGGEDKHGSPIRLDGATDDQIEMIVQDNLTGLESFNVNAQGKALS